jgi:hypothetical protein
MEMIVQRGPRNASAILGDLTIDGQHAVYTLERLGVEIPVGMYPVTLYPSPHFERMMPLLNDVPGRSCIEIHYGNYPTESDGCILVGLLQDVAAGEVLESVAAFNALFPAIEAAVEAEGCSITVND